MVTFQAMVNLSSNFSIRGVVSAVAPPFSSYLLPLVTPRITRTLEPFHL